MFWNATMPAWLGIGLSVAFALIALYFAFVARRHALAGEYTAKSKQRTIDALVKERDEERRQRILAQDQRTKLNRENAALHTHITIMGESLNAAQAEVERLNKPDLATLPLQEAVKPPMAQIEPVYPAENAWPKRRTRGGPKKEGAQ